LTGDGLIAGIETFGGETFRDKMDCYSISLSEAGNMEVISWEQVFKDSKRGTMLKISTDDKCFQSIAPGKDLGIKHDSKMVVWRNIIVICYQDSEMRLFAAEDCRIDFC
jgi:hypothetical protein